MNTVTVSLGTFVDRALAELQEPSEVGWQTPLLADITAGAASLTLTDASTVNVTDLLECGAELMLVTSKSADAIPVIGISRGYYKSTAASHSAGNIVTVNPQYARVRVAEAVQRSFPTLEAMGLPLIKAGVYSINTSTGYVSLGEDVRDVLRVSYLSVPDGRWSDLGGWRFVDAAPTATFPTGKLLSVSRGVSATTSLQVTTKSPYRWSSFPLAPAESDTILILEGAERVPSIYAAAWIVSRREISRSQINRSEEWNQGEPTRGGVSATLVRVLWQEFYRALDEAKRLPIIPLYRPYIPMVRI